MTNLSTKCTFYKNIVQHNCNILSTPGKTVNIIELLTNERYTNGDLLNKVRLSSYGSDEYKQLKRQLSAAAFSSVQDNMVIDRSDENHLFHTGFISFDIDTGKNPYLLTDGESVRDFIIENIPYVAYIGKSVSNLGYWGLFPILNKDDHYGHYEAMKQLFLTHKIEIDKTSDISRLRFLAYDPDGYINHEAKVFHDSIITEATIIIDDYERVPTDALFIAACRWVEAKHEITFQPGSIHNYLLYLYSTLRACHISRVHILNWVFNNLIEQEKITTNCLDETKWKR